MSNNIHLIAFGTFGNPNGFRQSFFFGNNELSKSIKTFDLNTNAISLFPNTQIYAIRKEHAGNQPIISYVKYSFAKEPNSDRSGSFIGSSLLFTDKIAEENITIELLNKVQESLIKNNVRNNVIAVNHSNQLAIKDKIDFDRAKHHLRSIENLNFTNNSNLSMVVYCKISPEKLLYYFKHALDLLSVYDTIYFTESDEIVKFVGQKNLFKVIQNVGSKKEFEQEIAELENERKRKISVALSDFENEKKRIQHDFKKTTEEFKKQLDRNKQTHQNNQKQITKSENDLGEIEAIYVNFVQKINELENLLRYGNSLAEIKKHYQEIKRRYNQNLELVKRPNSLHSISTTREKELIVKQPIEQPRNDRTDENKQENSFYKKVTFGLAILLIGTWVFLFFQKSSDETSIEPELQQQVDTNIHSINPSTSSAQITELNENDYRNVANHLMYNMEIGQVVTKIFELNPTQVNKYYVGKETDYAEELFHLNRQCFEERNGARIFIRDTIRHIPCYSK